MVEETIMKRSRYETPRSVYAGIDVKQTLCHLALSEQRVRSLGFSHTAGVLALWLEKEGERFSGTKACPGETAPR
jgi:hypothetical protein